MWNFAKIALTTLIGLTIVSSQLSAQNRPIDAVKSGTAAAPRTTDKIVGGTVAPKGKFPFQVALIVSSFPKGSELSGQFCGGSLIAQQWVLTAAHCVPDTGPEEVDVYVGSTVLPGSGSAASGSEGVRIHVGGIFSHFAYEPVSKDNDIALLKLIGPAPAALTTADPASAAIQDSASAVGKKVTVIGWGRTQEGGSSSSELREVEVTVQDPKVCEDNINAFLAQFPGTPSAKITANMFCAGVPEGGQDSCQGDSGGYLGTVIDAAANKHAQLGVVSWGIGCARADLFGVYTRVSNYTDWITEVMADN